MRNQPLLTPPAEAFFERVTWEGDIAAEWRPTGDPDSPVRISPERRFGKPSVAGISTDVIWEHVDAGESEDEVAADFGLSLGDVRWALSYESAHRAA